MSHQNTEPAGKFKLPRWVLITAGCILILLVLLFGGLAAYSWAYTDKVYQGVNVAGIDLSGLTYAAATDILGSKVGQLNKAGFIFTTPERQVTINPHVISLGGPDTAHDLVFFDTDGSFQQAWQFGRQGSWWQKISEQISGLLFGRQFDFKIAVDDASFQQTLKNDFFDLAKPGHDATLVLTKSGNDYQAEINSETIGRSFNYPLALGELTSSLTKKLTTPKINLFLNTDVPQVTAASAKPLLGQVPTVLARAPFKLTFNDKTWELNQDVVAGLLNFYSDGQTTKLGFDEKLLSTYLDKNIGPEVNQEMQNARFTLKDGRVTEFVGAQAGQKINVAETVKVMNRDLIDGNLAASALVVDQVLPTIATASVNDLGIKELIGVGLSKFSGSPANRRHNIAVGAAALNGLIIKPGEEFSLLQALGTIDASTGYLTELVIKGNKTIPEYGGGLCQIGTTMFRVALSSGLPITMRQNHSYRVSYYEPAGTDATIYNPAPDLRFINDTGNNILIQTKITGDNARFEFWGTKDGRRTHFIGQQESDDLYGMTPKIYNLVSPPPAKIVESLDLPLGKKKCTEKAHVGATTDFTYQIFYPNGDKQEKIFKSVYRPWQEVCLVGVEKLTEVPPNVVVPTDQITN